MVDLHYLILKWPWFLCRWVQFPSMTVPAAIINRSDSSHLVSSFLFLCQLISSWTDSLTMLFCRKLKCPVLVDQQHQLWHLNLHLASSRDSVKQLFLWDSKGAHGSQAPPDSPELCRAETLIKTSHHLISFSCVQCSVLYSSELDSPFLFMSAQVHNWVYFSHICTTATHHWVHNRVQSHCMQG